MNSVDLVLIFLISLFALRGFFKGLFREVFSLLGLSVGLIVAVRYNEMVSVLWADLWRSLPISPKIVTFIALFFVVYIAFSLLGWFLHFSTNFFPLKGFNRMGGAIIGVGKGATLLGLALFFMISSPMVPRQMKRSVEKSSLAPSLHQFGEEIYKVSRDKLFFLSALSNKSNEVLG